MSGSLNEVTLIGNVCADPDIRNTQDGRKIVNLRVATSEKWRDKNTNERKERTEFHRVVIFNEGLCRVAEQYVRKGSLLYIRGQLQTRSWEADGVKKYSTEIVLQGFNSTLTMLDSPRDNDQGQTPASPGASTPYNKADYGKASVAPNFDNADDTIPF